MGNIFDDIPENLPEEIFQDIIKTDTIRIERILSHGHSSPESGWYDQTQNEWVIVLAGQGVIEFADGRVVTLAQGDHLNIKSGEKYKVLGTCEKQVTVWLAMFYN